MKLKRSIIIGIVFCMLFGIILSTLSVSADGENIPPDKPTCVSPTDNQFDVSIYTTLKVHIIDVDGDNMIVDIYRNGLIYYHFENQLNDTDVESTPLLLDYNTTYTWYAIANDSHSETQSDTFTFTTVKFTDTYVDDNQIPSWYDSTHVKTIQEGIDNTTDDATVHIYNGTYLENRININKPVTIEGESKNDVIINGTLAIGSVINVLSNNVTLYNMTINAIDTSKNGLEIENGNDLTIENCNINSGNYGIFLYINCERTEIKNCAIDGCNFGIKSQSGSGNNITITKCNISNCLNIAIDCEGNNYNINQCIFNNILGLGLKIDGENSLISDCEFYECSCDDIIFISPFSNNININNIISTNNQRFIDVHQSDNVQINNVTHIGNRMFYFYQSTNVILSQSSFNTNVSGALIRGSTDIYLSNITLIETDTGNDGITIYGGCQSIYISDSYIIASTPLWIQETNELHVKNTKLLGYSPSNGYGVMLYYNGGSPYDCTFENMSINNFDTGFWIYGYSENIIVNNLTIYDCGSGVINQYGSDNHFSNLTIYDCTGDGFGIYKSVSNNTLKDSTIDNVGWGINEGWRDNAPEYTTFENVTVTNSTYGIYLDSAFHDNSIYKHLTSKNNSIGLYVMDGYEEFIGNITWDETNLVYDNNLDYYIQNNASINIFSNHLFDSYIENDVSDSIPYVNYNHIIGYGLKEFNTAKMIAYCDSGNSAKINIIYNDLTKWLINQSSGSIYQKLGGFEVDTEYEIKFDGIFLNYYTAITDTMLESLTGAVYVNYSGNWSKHIFTIEHEVIIPPIIPSIDLVLISTIIISIILALGIGLYILNSKGKIKLRRFKYK